MTIPNPFNFSIGFEFFFSPKIFESLCYLRLSPNIFSFFHFIELIIKIFLVLAYNFKSIPYFILITPNS
ncbi:unnamed protein product [Blepharisma stoltei]|uniref:Uncharacterized protein n=1 Tax=Blepharisma stoltei TaxID=1481888 RepID=A0AAU9JHY0_9CILI|nr:unnamed protein product [Blepharisma stoltei]